jgi:CBS domain-containing protein
MKSKAKDLMCANPQCCTPDISIQEAAKMMDKCDCGAIPVIVEGDQRKAVGVITDRDIALRAVAQGKGPETTVRECMSSPLAVVGVDSSAAECCEIMEQSKVRRLMVVDAEGELCGIISQADIARHLSKPKIAEVVKEVSEPTGEPSEVRTAPNGMSNPRM